MARHSKHGVRPRRGPWLLTVLVLAVGAGSVGAVRVLSAEPASTPRTCVAPVGTLSVGAAPAAVPWLRELAADYTAQRRPVAGRCAAVEVRPLTQDQAQQALQPVPFPGAGSPPDVWIPESSTSVALLRARKDSARVLTAAAPPIATSPVVLAAPADAMQLLARPGQQPQLADLVGLLRDPRGWGQPALGHPEWGPIKVSTLDPGTTSLGTGMLLALAGVLTRTPTTEVGAKAFEQPAAREGLLGLVRAFGRAPPTGAALMAAVSEGSTAAQVISGVGVVVAYEQDVWRYDRDSPAIVLATGYPLDGQLAADFPYVVPTGSWVDDGDRAAAADFRAWLVSPEVQARLDGFGLRRADGTAGPAVAQGLRVDSVAPLAARPQQAPDGPTAARTVWRLLTRRISLLGLFDVSGSMAEPVPGSTRSKLDVARAAAQSALGYFDARDSIGLWEFSRALDGDKDYRVLVPLGPAGAKVNGYPNRQAASVAAYRAMVPRTATGLYDSILAAYRSATAAYQPDCVNTLVVITDGANEDPGSIELPALLAELRRLHDPARPVHIVTLAYGTGADPAALAQVAKVTDGLQFSSPDPNSISKVFVTAVAALTG